MTFDFARPQAKDIAGLAAFYRQCRADTDMALLPDYFLSLPPSVFSEVWEKVFGEPARFRAILAMRDSIKAGFYTVGPLHESDRAQYLDACGLPPCTGELFQLYVAAADQGKGLGRILYQRALHDLRDLGYDACVICTYVENTKAIAFYEAMGAKIIRETVLAPPWNRPVVFLRA